ncbi:hypothetical protein JCM19233_2709 [Vibrio astriarenae]|nr:hypothetical protein JCM19233_2709 [Vibrio sp. C7]
MAIDVAKHVYKDCKMSQVNNEYQMAIDLLCCHLGVTEKRS